MIRGCEFREDKPQIALGEKVRRAIITDNTFKGKQLIENKSSLSFNIANNASEQ